MQSARVSSRPLASAALEIALVGSHSKCSGGPEQYVAQRRGLVLDAPAHSATTLIVSSLRSLAPRRLPPCSSVVWM